MVVLYVLGTFRNRFCNKYLPDYQSRDSSSSSSAFRCPLLDEAHRHRLKGNIYVCEETSLIKNFNFLWFKIYFNVGTYLIPVPVSGNSFSLLYGVYARTNSFPFMLYILLFSQLVQDVIGVCKNALWCIISSSIKYIKTPTLLNKVMFMKVLNSSRLVLMVC